VIEYSHTNTNTEPPKILAANFNHLLSK